MSSSANRVGIGLHTNPKLDVLIIGGGPAGASAAIGCAVRSLRTMVFERQPFPREHPGETLHPGVEALLKSLGVNHQVNDCGFIRHAGHWVSWNGPRRFVPFGGDEDGPWLGYQAWRADFDRILLDRVRTLGVRIEPARDNELIPIMIGPRVVGIRSARERIFARYVIDASGSRQWLQRNLRLEESRYSPPLIAFYGYGSGECPELEDAPVFEADGAGWTWMAKVRPHLFQWTRLALSRQKATCRRIPHRLLNLRPSGRVKGADVTWRILSRPAGPGYFAVGDAASVLDPASSHGVLRALMSGMMAAHMIGGVEGGQHEPLTAARQYQDWLKTSFDSDVRRLRELYRELRPCPQWLA